MNNVPPNLLPKRCLKMESIKQLRHVAENMKFYENPTVTADLGKHIPKVCLPYFFDRIAATTPQHLSIDVLHTKSTEWLKHEHDIYRGVRIGMYQYSDENDKRLDLKLLLDYVNDLKSILDTRENIPNKKERKELRRKAAEKGR